MKESRRLSELRLSILLNRLKKVSDYRDIKKNLKILNAIIDVYIVNGNEMLLDMYQDSIGNILMGATNKELKATLLKYYKNHAERYNRLGISRQMYTRRFSQIDDSSLNEEFIDNLVPRYAKDDDYYAICVLISSFIDIFRLPKIKKEYELKQNNRSVELVFWLIYTKLYEYFKKIDKVYDFVKIICAYSGIDYDVISELLYKISVITRSNIGGTKERNHFIYEMCNLGYDNDITRGWIAYNIFGIDNQVVFHPYYTSFMKDIRNNENEFLLVYRETLEWKKINKEEVMKFNDLFVDFSNLDL